MIGGNNLCMNCMNDMGESTVCNKCGFNIETDLQMESALAYHTVLQNRYMVGRAIVCSGEGITYIGYDMAQNLPIGLKEYFPYQLCLRDSDQKTVFPVSGCEILFDDQLVNFLQYARKIAHLREINSICPVYDIFEENGTAYTVSVWTESISLRYFVERSGGKLHWNAARQIFMPVLSALSALHEAGIGHYGISPATLSIMPDGKMSLTGFEIESVRRMNTGMTPDLVAGCAAYEQYNNIEPLDEATDVYGFAASLFFALTGTLPQDAAKRAQDARLLIPTAILKMIPPQVVTALANALQVEREDRTQTFERLRAELSAAPTVTASIEETQSIKRIVSPYQSQTHMANAQEKKKKTEKRIPDFVWIIGSCLATVVILGLIALVVLSVRDGEAEEESSVLSAYSSEITSEVSSEVSSMDENSIPVPNLLGQDYEALIESLDGSGDYEILLGTKEFNDEYEEGLIISQTPSAGENQYMQKGDVIVVNISRGSAMRTLPSIAGDSLTTASEKLSALGLTPTKVDVYSDSVPAGYVVGYQSYSAGSQVQYGSQVIIEVSQGKDLNQ